MMILFLLSLILSDPLWQKVEPVPDCLAYFKNAFQKFKDGQKDPSKGLSMSYQVDITNSDNEVQTDKIFVKVSSNKVLLKSNEVTLYQDGTTMVTVQEKSQAIFISNAVPANYRKMQLAGMLQQQDSLLTLLKLKACTDEMFEKWPCIKMTFEVPEQLKNTGIRSAAYWIDSNDQTIRKIIIHYDESEERPFKSWEVKMNEMDPTYRGTPFAGPAVAVVLEASKLRKIYQGYTLIDQRK